MHAQCHPYMRIHTPVWCKILVSHMYFHHFKNRCKLCKFENQAPLWQVAAWLSCFGLILSEWHPVWYLCLAAFFITVEGVMPMCPRINVSQDWSVPVPGPMCPRTEVFREQSVPGPMCPISNTCKQERREVAQWAWMDWWICVYGWVDGCICVSTSVCVCVCVCVVCLRVQKIQARENREMREMTTAVTSPSQQYCRQSIGLKLVHWAGLHKNDIVPRWHALGVNWHLKP